MNERTLGFFEWAREQPWWSIIETVLSSGLIAVVTSRDGPPIDLVPPTRRAQVEAGGGVVFAGAYNEKTGAGFAVVQSDTVDTWTIQVVPVGSRVGEMSQWFGPAAEA